MTPLAADERFFAPPGAAARSDTLQRVGLSGAFVLSAGTLEPRKNLPRLLDAWRGLPAAVRGNTTLAIAGPAGWEAGELQQSVDDTGGTARLLGFVSDDDLLALYASCTAFAYPALYEGFGLPVLEAMAAGAPVLTSSVSSLPEVAADAAVLVDPTDVAAIREGLAQLLGDAGLRERLTLAGRAQAGTFSWARTARQTVAALEAIAVPRS